MRPKSSSKDAEKSSAAAPKKKDTPPTKPSSAPTKGRIEDATTPGHGAILMAPWGHTAMVPTKHIHFDPELTPQFDAEFDRRLHQAIDGQLPVYFAAVPLALCVPFDLDYRPDLHPGAARVIAAMFEEAKRQQLPQLLVYPRGKWFMVSDDYLPLFAALQGLFDYVPCWVLGKPENDLLRDVQGPVAIADVPKVCGIE